MTFLHSAIKVSQSRTSISNLPFCSVRNTIPDAGDGMSWFLFALTVGRGKGELRFRQPSLCKMSKLPWDLGEPNLPHQNKGANMATKKYRFDLGAVFAANIAEYAEPRTTTTAEHLVPLSRSFPLQPPVIAMSGTKVTEGATEGTKAKAWLLIGSKLR
ncbi:hypothetical protein AJ80_07327 [Polytolypa hystricis UAMH7299]|uniref:Uncharacterized protein n=1 Tax=Polytolypa hystricis (strain UAMH7299) TaxID=1447883 RepID=A0A2B7XPV0_POLH7|nr:hypothetical protein AJ80_07327 [Polytolypa hystricis UAMH7299]